MKNITKIRSLLLALPLVSAAAIAEDKDTEDMNPLWEYWAKNPSSVVVYGRAEVFLNSNHGYNKINDNYEIDDYGDGEFSQTEVNTLSSRFGVKGELPTMIETLKIVYKYEVGVGKELYSRNQAVGIKSSIWGEVMAGRHDSALKKTVKSKLTNLTTDLFHNFPGADYEYSLMGKNRLDHMVGYKSPTLKDFDYFMTLSPEEETETGDGKSTGLSQALSYTSKDLGIYLLFAADRNIANRDINRIILQYVTGKFYYTAVVQESEAHKELATNTQDDDQYAILFNAAYSNKRSIYKMQLSESRETDNELIFTSESLKQNATKSRQLTLGYDYLLTDVITLSSYISARNYSYVSGYDGNEETDKIAGVGIWFKF
ncbi:putative porin [Sinobacterium caligoides]|uniref:Putative porin n=1 Tax=Sinobacterium caligoides TaxID=933926 RepID=A0A3N2DZA7_9GAMM|nr:hypothetical protein [Sinobacterium caligoides]ROS04625.1 putative porin [Sinobacterium caligoides]